MRKRRSGEPLSHNRIFLNYPYDDDFRRRFLPVILYVIVAFGYDASAAEGENGERPVRLEKIRDMIPKARQSLHELSRPGRFNMPLELGLALGHQAYSSRKGRDPTRILVVCDNLGTLKVRCSDLNALDPVEYAEEPAKLVNALVNWIGEDAERQGYAIYAPQAMLSGYNAFSQSLQNSLPDWQAVDQAGAINTVDAIPFWYLAALIKKWLEANPVLELR